MAVDAEQLGTVSTRFGKVGMFRGFQGTQRGFGVPFPTPGRVSWAQSLCICPDSVYGSDGASALPWALQSSLGISFRISDISPVLARCDSLSYSWSSVPVPLQQLSGYLQIFLSVLLSLIFQTHSLAVGSLFSVSCHSIPCPSMPQLSHKTSLGQALP